MLDRVIIEVVTPLVNMLDLIKKFIFIKSEKFGS